ncbi:hypothetical protein JCM31598_07130 [Desulfonatronum parangueonense]
MQKKTKITTKQAIALKCLECCCDDWDEVFQCPASGKGETTKCFLYDLRPKKRMDDLKSIFFDKDGSRSDAAFSIKRETRKGTDLKKQPKTESSPQAERRRKKNSTSSK